LGGQVDDMRRSLQPARRVAKVRCREARVA
jgi:hypothetical protein